MLHVGLTGGIASGKSTVAAMMRKRNCQVLEADRIAHRLMEPGQPAYDEILREFGEQVRAPSGSIARQKLAAIVFANPAKLRRLNRIVHPQVIEALDRQLAEIERTDRSAVVVVEAALLVESGYFERLDRLVVAWCRPEQQIERLLTRGLTREEAQQRIAAQMDLAQKRRMADEEVDCSGPLERTELQVEALVAKLKQLAATTAAKGQAEG
ncbi:MAG TPA: dephospho-CoA kinase [Candidatus Acidoferrales bacterium]|jgi:dephospho-CoA kinase|nr:dephospho-CoA kinase [Candidatus Acidoferrales bacterium]